MAVAFDAVGAGANGSGGTSKNLTYSHTATGLNLAVVGVQFCAVDGAGIVPASCSMTYNGVSMTQLGSQRVNNSNSAYYLIFYGLLNPPTGAQTVSSTAAPGGSITILATNTVSFTGVGSFGTFGSSFGASTSLSQSITAPADGMLAQAFHVQTTGATLSAYNQTSRYATTLAVVGNGAVLGTAAGTGSATSFTATASTSTNWASVAVPVLAPGAAPTNTGQFFGLL